MSTKLCPNCGAPVASDARFCRACGTSLRGTTTDNLIVSPHDATIPLSGSGHVTGELDSSDRFSNRSAQNEKTSAKLDGGDEERTRLYSPKEMPPPAAYFDSEATLVQSRPAVSPGANQNPNQTSVLNSAAQTGSIDFASNSAPLPPPAADRGARPFPVAPAITAANNVPQQVYPSPKQAASPNPALSPPPPRAQAAPANRGRVWLFVGGGTVLLFALAALIGAWLAYRSVQETTVPVSADVAVTPSPLVSASDARTEAAQKLAEAEVLLTAGRTDDGIALLREAIALDATNADAHRQLGVALEAKGERAEAIAEYKEATTLDPSGITAWRAVANAQFADQLYADSVASYRRLFELTPNGGIENGVDDALRLRFADALRQTNETEEARRVYVQLAASNASDIAAQARAHLSELTAANAKPTPSAQASPDPRANANSNRADRAGEFVATTNTPAANVPAVSPSPNLNPQPAQPPPPAALTPQQRFDRAVQLWSSNRATATAEFRAVAGSVPDANYYLGLSYAEGRDPASLDRAALLAALGHFQRARGGRYAAQARRYEDQLTKEYDRRRSQ